MKKLLLTGYGPFGDFKFNPSQDVVVELSGEVIQDFQVIGKILPVSYQNAGDTLIEIIKSELPDAVICLGLAADRTKITPELIAINYMHAQTPDNEGIKKIDEKISHQGESAYFSTLPIQMMLRELDRHSIPSELSSSAGKFVCNLTKYHLLHYLNKEKIEIPAGFIHLPSCLEKKILFNSIRICIQCLSDQI